MIRIGLAALVLSVAACSAEQPAWRRLDSRALTADQTEQSRRAIAARDGLAQRLKARLMAAVEDGGPSAGIAACRIEAPELAAAIASEEGLRIGRTSHRLRNPANGPPEWARATVEAARGELELFAGPNGELGALLPIRLEPQCVVCHGTPPEPVRAALAEHYPADRATGFAAGELRGWFWVEVPGIRND